MNRTLKGKELEVPPLTFLLRFYVEGLKCCHMLSGLFYDQPLFWPSGLRPSSQHHCEKGGLLKVRKPESTHNIYESMKYPWKRNISFLVLPV